MPDVYTFSSRSSDRSPSSISNGGSPELSGRLNSPNLGPGASPVLPGNHFDDSPGSAYGGVNSANVRRTHPTTPDGVNAQCSVLSRLENDSQQRNNTDRGEASNSGNSRLITVDTTQLTQIVRSVIQEEVGALRGAVQDNLMDLMVDQIHMDIIHLQAEMLLKLQQQHVRTSTDICVYPKATTISLQFLLFGGFCFYCKLICWLLFLL